MLERFDRTAHVRLTAPAGLENCAPLALDNDHEPEHCGGCADNAAPARSTARPECAGSAAISTARRVRENATARVSICAPAPRIAQRMRQGLRRARERHEACQGGAADSLRAGLRRMQWRLRKSRSDPKHCGACYGTASRQRRYVATATAPPGCSSGTRPAAALRRPYERSGKLPALAEKPVLAPSMELGVQRLGLAKACLPDGYSAATGVRALTRTTRRTAAAASTHARRRRMARPYAKRQLGLVCQPRLHRVGGKVSTLDTSRDHAGKSSTICATGQVCQAGSCARRLWQTKPFAAGSCVRSAVRLANAARAEKSEPRPPTRHRGPMSAFARFSAQLLRALR